MIETQSEEQVSRQVKETNHLIIRENETRNVGVVQHNHTIIERVPRYVVRVPVVTTVSYVTQRYRVVETPATVTVPVEYRPARRCARQALWLRRLLPPRASHPRLSPGRSLSRADGTTAAASSENRRACRTL